MTGVTYIRWTGHNIDEIQAHATAGGFGITLGSPVHCTRDCIDDDGAFECDGASCADPTVLEVYPPAWFDRTDDYTPVTWTHADPGNLIGSDGSVIR